VAKGLLADPPPNGVPGRWPGPAGCPKTGVALFAGAEGTAGCPKGEGRAPRPLEVPKVGAVVPSIGVAAPNEDWPKPDPPDCGFAESNPVLVQDGLVLPRLDGVPKAEGTTSKRRS
jgi:hypothetical protein